MKISKVCRMFVLLVGMSICSQPVHADEYRDTLAVLMQYSKVQLAAVFRASNVLEQYKKRWGEGVANAYSNFVQSDNYFQMLVDIYEPECRRQLSQDELNELLYWYRTSIQSTLTQRTHAMNINITTAPYADYVDFLNENIQKTEKVVKNAKKGKATKVVPMRMPKNYRAEAERYARGSGMTDISGMMREMITPAIRRQFPKLTEEDMQLPLVQEYLDHFMQEAQLGTLYKTVSLSELEYVNKGLESEVFCRFSQIAISQNKYNGLIAMKELGAFVYWLKRYMPAEAQRWDNMFTKMF